MDFHDDHTAFDTTSTRDVGDMYIPGADDHGFGEDAGHDTGPGDAAGGVGGTASGGGGGTASGGHTITGEAGGHAVEAEATVDSDRDGTSDTAVVQPPDGDRIAFTDSDGDGHADRAAVYGGDGR